MERIARAEFLLRFSTELGQNLTIGYGVRGRYDSSRNYKRMADLMGATHLRDVDYFLIDDDTYSNSLQNDLRNPNRLVAEGERFSYDYELVARSLQADVMFEYAVKRWHINVDLAVGVQEQLRRGYFEKELFPGDKSYGRSAKVDFAPYTIKAMAGYSFSARHNISLAAMVSEAAPDVKNLFLNPLYNNRVVDNPTTEKRIAAELNYKFSSTALDLLLTAYFTQTTDERDVFRATMTYRQPTAMWMLRGWVRCVMAWRLRLMCVFQKCGAHHSRRPRGSMSIRRILM